MLEQVEELRDRLQELGKRQFVAGPQTEESILEVERLLSVEFPPSYRIFLKTYGGGFGVSGIWRNNSSATNPGTVWGDTLRVREQYKLESNLIPLYFIPLGGACCLDFSRRDSQGECPVVEVSVKLGGEEIHIAPHSDTFEDFLIWHLKHLVAAFEEVTG